MAANTDNNANDNSLLQPMYNQILGASGTWISGGFIQNEEYNTALLWRRGIDVYDHMRRSDASIQAMLKVVKHPLLAATWDIEPASDEEFDQYVARFVRSELFDRNVVWSRFLRDALGKCDFGFSVFEKTYELTEFEQQARVGIKELGWRKQWSILRWEMSNGQPGVSQQLLGELVDIPQEKLLVFVNDREGDNYQGISLLRYVYKDWDLKKSVENLMIVDLMRSLGFPVVEYNDQASKDDQQKMENWLKNFRSHERQYAFFPVGKFKIDWMKVDSNTDKFIQAMEYLQHEIDKSILAQFIDLSGSRSGGSGGSRALSEDHSQLFEKALEAIANEVVDELNGNLIQQLCDLNWSNMPNGYPKLTYSNIGDSDLKTLGDFLNKVAAVDLITPDRDMENHIREVADLPNLPDDVYDNYADRTTAQTAAVPLTTLGPSQNPNSPQPTGQVRENPPIGHSKPGTKLPSDQTNRVQPVNLKRDRANQPTPEANTYKLLRSANATKAAEELSTYRRDLLARVMADETDDVLAA
jgi:phage gp29-like protein